MKNLFKDKDGKIVIGQWPNWPLPLLTSSGNGQSGGDYAGKHMDIVGSWAGDIISIEHEPTYTLNKPISFIEGDETENSYKFLSKELEAELEAERKAKEKEKKIREEEIRMFEKSGLSELMA